MHKFKVGDWVHSDFSTSLSQITKIDPIKKYYTLKINGYGCEHYEGIESADIDFEIWEPMQELKDQLATKDKEIQELKERLQKIYDNFKDFK